jgi:hypothetical protein
MNITKQQLQKIIKEEIKAAFGEGVDPLTGKKSAITGASEGPPEGVEIGSRIQGRSGVWEWAEGFGITNGMPDESKPGWALVNPMTGKIN